jgi:hypothetical protein
MKTTKPKSGSQAKTKKAAGEAKPVRKKKSTVKEKTPPTEEAIREKAREIYFERIARGEHGTAEDDWKEAEELLMGS